MMLSVLLRRPALLLAPLLFALALVLAPSPAFSDNGNSATSSEQTSQVHPAIQQANETRAREQRRKRLLMLFPLGVVGIIGVLLVVTRHKRPGRK